MADVEPGGETPADQLSVIFAEILDDYLDQCDSLDEVDSVDLAQQLAGAVFERAMPPGVQYGPTIEALRQAWGH